MASARSPHSWRRTAGVGTLIVVAAVTSVVFVAYMVVTGRERHPTSVQPQAFILPLKNIACLIGTDEAGDFVRCDVGSYTYQVPTRPTECAPEDWGHTVIIRAGGTAGFGCASDFLLDPTLKVLDYGASVSSGPFKCVSAETGVECTGGGDTMFRLSRGDYALR